MSGWPAARSGRVVEGDGLDVGGDALDEVGEDLARADLDEGVDAGGRHGLDRAHPVDAARQVLDELGAAGFAGGQRPRVGVGQQRRDRVAEGDVGEDAAHALGRVGHQRRMGGHADRQHDGPLGAQALGRLGGGLRPRRARR